MSSKQGTLSPMNAWRLPSFKIEKFLTCRSWLLAVALLCLMVLQASMSIRQKSVTFDEPLYTWMLGKEE